MSRYRRYLLLLLCLSLSVLKLPLHAAIAFDASSSGSGGPVTTVSFSHTLGSGANRLMVVVVATEDNVAADAVISGATFNGVAMTLVPSSRSTLTASATNESAIFYLLDASLPAAGTYTVEITTAGASTIIGGGLSFFGARQQAAEAVATNTTTTTDVSTSITTVTNGAWVVDVLSNAAAASNPFTTTTTGMVERLETVSGGHSSASATKATTTAGSTTMSWHHPQFGRETHSVAAFAEMPTLTGTVFEDVNYAGGSGRSNATASGSVVSGARVELFDGSGNYLSATTTDGSGNYSFTVTTSTSYTVRVVNSSVVSSHGGSSLVPVQTYRTTATGGSAVAVTDYVGGEDPVKIDAGNGSTTLAALTTGSLTPQSITAVNVGANSVAGLDFGFNFNTIVSTRDAGQGSLRQLITNANGMSGTQSSVFMITDGSAHNGLRAGLTNQLTSGVAIITLSSLLPQITDTLTLDATTQTTNVGNTNAGTLGTGGTVGVDAISLSTVNRPEVELISAQTIGFDIAAASSTIKGFALRGSLNSGANAEILINGVSGVTLTQNVIGATATSFALPATGRTEGLGISLTGTVGSATISNNLIGFTRYHGIATATTTSGVTVSLNEITSCGRNSANMGGIDLLGSSHTISSNLITGSKGQAIDNWTANNNAHSIVNNTISGNGVGTIGSRETAGIRLRGSNSTVDRNIITANYGAGILMNNGGSGNRFTRNSIYNNGTITNDSAEAASGNIGIDLQNSSDNSGPGTAPYYTINDTGDSDGGGNSLVNFPILEAAAIAGSNLVLTGWARSGTIIELFISDGDASGFGEGQTYLATVTEGSGSDTDSSSSSYSGSINGVSQGSDTTNRFQFTLALPGGVSAGTKLTATGTDASNNTSEFSGQVTVTNLTLSGKVFEDTGYTGGSGRNNATASGSARSSARVELFDASGNYLSATTTDGSGDYVFALSASGSYTIRVVNSSVTSSLGGTSLVPVQTYRTTAISGSAVTVTDRVGGEDPTKADAGNGSTTLAALTTGSLTPQSITAATIAATPITGLDFGYNFNTIVNTADTGQGSLRQFITNANGMSGTQSSVFMITDGSAHNGLRAGLTNQLTSSVAIITLSSLLPQITGTLTLDATTQTSLIGNTNTGTLGTGGTVGVDALTLSTLNRPEVEIVGTNSLQQGFDLAAASITLKGFAIHGFGNNTSRPDILITSGDGITLTQLVIGTTASAFSLPATTTGGPGIRVNSGATGTISNNLIGFTAWNGITIAGAVGTGWTIQNNEVRGCGISGANFGGLDIASASATVSGNLFAANKGQGIDVATSATSANLVNNTVSGNGVGTLGTSETMGIRIRASLCTIDRNIVAANYGAGILMIDGFGGTHITKNSVYNNGTILNDASSAATGQIGIDLLSSSDNIEKGTAPFYTLNDATDSDSGANGLFNYPVLDTATVIGSTLELTGWVASGATVEFFLSDGDPSGFGEGQTYIGSVTEGSGSDTDATSSSYSGNVNCFAQGSGTTVPRFKYTFALPGGITAGTTKLTATATNGSNNTSEFSGNVTVYTAFPNFTVLKSSQAYSDPLNATTNPKAIPGSFILLSAVATNTYPARNDTNTFVFSDAIPTNTELYVSDLGGAGSGPVAFTDGATTSALTYTFTSLASTTDDVAFSNDGGTTWTYTPTPDVNGCDTTVTHIRLNPKGSFAKSACGNNPSLTLAFRVRVK